MNRLFRRDFTMVVAGQIISLFGNAILRFALPLYLLRETDSSSLFGAVTACSFIPLIVFSLLGGVLADRKSKRNIMVVLDFSTAAAVLIFELLLGRISLVPLMIAALMILYGISGAYQPAVQAAIPLLTPPELLMKGNAVINMVSTLSGLLGPVIGGILFGAFGIVPILLISAGCFACSAVMEIFINIPEPYRGAAGKKEESVQLQQTDRNMQDQAEREGGIRQITETGHRNTQGQAEKEEGGRAEEADCRNVQKGEPQKNVLQTLASDLAESFRFIRREKPVLFSVLGVLALFNLVMSAAMIVGIPVMVVQILGMSDTALGFTQGAMGLGGLAGGMLAGAAAQKMRLRKGFLTLAACAGATFVMGLALLEAVPQNVGYFVITAASFGAMCISTLFSVFLLTAVQQQTPPRLLGKIMAVIMAVAGCSQPAGQALYGILFELCADIPWAVLFGSAAASLAVALYSKRIFIRLQEECAGDGAV